MAQEQLSEARGNADEFSFAALIGFRGISELGPSLNGL
jgi:hypothetical protein